MLYIREGVELQGLASGPYINLRWPLLSLITVLASSESVFLGFLGLKNQGWELRRPPKQGAPEEECLCLPLVPPVPSTANELRATKFVCVCGGGDKRLRDSSLCVRPFSSLSGTGGDWDPHVKHT